MLEPGSRTLLLDALRPPEGYHLEVAVGTTFSLDLQALLLPPLAFALFDWAGDEDASANPIALLEAVRRNAERMTVFCQAGQIGVPRNYRSLLVYLEDCVVEAAPPDTARIFHPKVWALKFVAESQPDAYRLLCLSRNLTFDRAWDTALVLDGEPAQRDKAGVRRRNRPLTEFLTRLPSLARRPLDSGTTQRVEQLATELAAVEWLLPEGFSDITFHALGLGGRPPDIREDGDRMLVVSPFLTRGALTRLSSSPRPHVLVSRQESLDDVGAEGVGGFAKTYVLAPHAWAEFAAEDGDTVPATDTAVPVDESVAEAADVELTGLHAKLFVAQRPNEVRVFTGSANATDAAFSGNIEFMVELATNPWRVHIDKLLEPGGEQGSLRDLLQPYAPASHEPPPESEHQQVQRILDEARRRLGLCHFTAQFTDVADGYELRLHATTDDALELDEIDRVLCWPISLGAGTAVIPKLLPHGLEASLGKVSPESVTGFFAFELTAHAGSARDGVRLVVNAEIRGGPTDRRERVLVDLLRSRSDVLRYLLFLLAQGGVEAQVLADALTGDLSAGDPQGPPAQWQIPLFESMIRALSEDPARLDHLAKVITDIERSGQGAQLLPEELTAVWEPIWRARQELGR